MYVYGVLEAAQNKMQAFYLRGSLIIANTTVPVWILNQSCCTVIWKSCLRTQIPPMAKKPRKVVASVTRYGIPCCLNMTNEAMKKKRKAISG
jgi:hypothetical protein